MGWTAQVHVCPAGLKLPMLCGAIHLISGQPDSALDLYGVLVPFHFWSKGASVGSTSSVLTGNSCLLVVTSL